MTYFYRVITQSYLILALALLPCPALLSLSEQKDSTEVVEELKTLISQNFFALESLDSSVQARVIEALFKYLQSLTPEDQVPFITGLYYILVHTCSSQTTQYALPASIIYTLAVKFNNDFVEQNLSVLKTYGANSEPIEWKDFTTAIESDADADETELVATFSELSLNEEPEPCEDLLEKIPLKHFPITLRKVDYALLRAVYKNRPHLIAKLVARGASLFCQDSRGRTPLIIAAERGHHKTVSALFACAADGATIEEMKACWYWRGYGENKVQYTALDIARIKNAELSGFFGSDEWIDALKKLFKATQSQLVPASADDVSNYPETIALLEAQYA